MSDVESDENVEKEPHELDSSSDEGGKIENADMAELDYDVQTVEEKIAAGNKEREAGNELFREGRFKEAWKLYDRAFVYIYTSKEQWERMDGKEREAINQFKKPCHLNRGLCRMRTGDFRDAHWDFSEALRIDPKSVKALFRRGWAQLRICQEEVQKERQGVWWDLEKAEEELEQARADLYSACRAAPQDLVIRRAIREFGEVRERLKLYRKKYNADLRKLYSSFIVNLDKDNKRKKKIEDEQIYKDMPDLERVHIE